MTIIEKLKAGEELAEEEIQDFLYSLKEVKEIREDSHRWFTPVSTILQEENGDYWEVDWNKGNTEYQENEYPNQPYRVKKEIKMIEVEEFIKFE